MLTVRMMVVSTALANQLSLVATDEYCSAASGAMCIRCPDDTLATEAAAADAAALRNALDDLDFDTVCRHHNPHLPL